jgi:KDO2-lipid IV(A) lauroyltransferase
MSMPVTKKSTMNSPQHSFPSEEITSELTSLRPKNSSARRAAFEKRLMGTVAHRLENTSWQSCRRLGAMIGLAFFKIGRRRAELAVDNVVKALEVSRPEALRIARRASQNWGMTTCEFLHQRAASPQEIRDYVSLDGVEHLQTALQEGKGAILLMAHLGNWEVLIARLGQEFPLAGIVRPLSNAAVQDHMSDVRRATGMALISKHNAARPAIRALRAGSALCILPDRHAGAEGALLPLFGHPTRFETAPARLALMSGAPIVPAFGVRREPWRGDGRIEGHIFPSFQVHAANRDERDAATIEGTKRVIASLETIVRQYPDQWSWMLRRWRDDDVSPV